MKVAVVANGPSAEGMGREIDACDRVVRMRAFWAHAAEHAGSRTDAVAWFGGAEADVWLDGLTCEHWFTHCPRQLDWLADDYQGCQRLRRFSAVAGLSVVHMLTDDLWDDMRRHLGRHPSTGFVAVAMTLEIYRPTELHLFGFDATSVVDLRDARREIPEAQKRHHDMAAEKAALAELDRGSWISELTNPPRIVWHGRPNL